MRAMQSSTSPLCKDAFEEFFGHCPLTAPVTTTSNLMTEFHLSDSSDSWIDDFESLESVIEFMNEKKYTRAQFSDGASIGRSRSVRSRNTGCQPQPSYVKG
ncbi:hypothetical protein GUITHDRAFT_119811 [Guillardia theta CCMP2712]|uniref:Uncharacterized protein n=1 Tax=Guillardia theta (strain CCMP2712) TaxID=905079 RepID=L1IDV3_GUITC|nr:hypothetical protein GUITHDRAFT_119811 [Guillardia theta CCMP2712]EKX34010.1 hypothetical protein GUITHDRAFT_119811 [Guillardia theta CCMP2712]|eukprot:XP_005820990.1 hypothetical protein GUITHDRAFT_119811 [Guillardia theta CCMP2712]